ncbi:Fcf2 pre-rRNA processing-domain-containing protein [Haematococcus lacustris]
MLGKLAASIKAALQAKLGQPTRGQPAASLATARSAAAAEQEQDQGAGAGTHRGAAAVAARDLAGADLHWEPAVPLPAAKASQRAALRLSEPGNKEAGLAKKLLAPPRLTAKTCVSQASGSKGLGTAGKAWFDLPAQKIDADTKRELRLLRLRGAFDTKRFYKSFDNTKFPKYFVKGTVVEGPADYYSGRLAAVQRRKATLTEQLLADAELTASRKKRFSRIQEDATQYQKVKKRKTDLPREQKRKPAPKH